MRISQHILDAVADDGRREGERLAAIHRRWLETPEGQRIRRENIEALALTQAIRMQHGGNRP